MSVQRHQPIRVQVATLVRNAIIEQDFVAGQVLIERELCEMTEASRASVREAIRQLEAEGLVETQNGRGVVVTALSPENAREIYEVRAALEGLAARLFVIHATEHHIAGLTRAVEMFDLGVAERWSTKRLLAIKVNIYDILFEGSGNEVLRTQVESLHHRVAQFRALNLGQEGRPEKTAGEMHALLDAVLRNDAIGAEKAAIFHVERAAAVSIGSLATSP